jgi:hypothetical protein
MIYIADNRLAHAARTAHQEALMAIPDPSTPFRARLVETLITAPVCRTGAENLIAVPGPAGRGRQASLSNFRAQV